MKYTRTKGTYKGGKGETLALDAYARLMRAAESLRRRAQEPLVKSGLTLSQLGVLEALYYGGPMSQVRIGERILRSGGNVTLIIDSLEERGFVVREQMRQDRRHYIVEITDAGRRLMSRVFPVHAARVMKDMSVLSQSELEDLSRSCKKLSST